MPLSSRISSYISNYSNFTFSVLSDMRPSTPSITTLKLRGALDGSISPFIVITISPSSPGAISHGSVERVAKAGNIRDESRNGLVPTLAHGMRCCGIVPAFTGSKITSLRFNFKAPILQGK